MIPDLKGNPILFTKKISNDPAIPGNPGIMKLLMANIKKKVLIMGGLHKIILWNPEEYEMFEKSSELTDLERIQKFGWGDTEDQE